MVGSVNSNPIGPNQTGSAARTGEPVRAKAVEAEAGGPARPGVATEGAELTLVRESLWRTIGLLELSVGAAREASKFLAQASDSAQAPEALSRYQDAIEQGIAAGAAGLAGVSLKTLADTQGGLIEIEGEDLRLPPGEAPPIEALARKLEGVIARYSASSTQLVAHEQTLMRLEGAAPPSGAELDADGARLMALQVRQDLSSGGYAIGGPASSSILSLFRAG